MRGLRYKNRARVRSVNDILIDASYPEIKDRKEEKHALGCIDSCRLN